MIVKDQTEFQAMSESIPRLNAEVVRDAAGIEPDGTVTIVLEIEPGMRAVVNFRPEQVMIVDMKTKAQVSQEDAGQRHQAWLDDPEAMKRLAVKQMARAIGLVG